MKNCIIVGGGISGLFAAIMAKDNCDKVTVIESADSCGGLLCSWKNTDGITFDFGTHILSETAHDPINQVLFKGMYERPELWHSLAVTKVSNVFNGQRYDKGQFIALPFLDELDYHKALDEVKEAPGMALDDAAHLQQFAQANYGQTITEKIFRPVMKKLQDSELEQLHPISHVFFALNRFVPGDAEFSRELKKSLTLDARLAFASYNEGLSSAVKFYPKARRGIQLWVEQLINQAQEKGVEIKISSRITELSHNDGAISAVILQNGETLPCEHLVWTIPPIFAIKQLGLTYQGVSPKFCPMSLHHLVFDRPFVDKNYYSQINDFNSQSFRVTFYPNITLDESKAPYNCTVEVLCSDIKDKEILNKMVEQELKNLGYVDQDAILLSYDIVDIPMGFPQFTNDFVAEKKRQITLIEDNINNISLIGKASKQEFFVYGIVQETYNQLSKLFGLKAL
jgi:protoporphyrinogen oxidase